MERHIKLEFSKDLAIPAGGIVEADVDIFFDGTVTVLEAHLNNKDITNIVTITTD